MMKNRRRSPWLHLSLLIGGTIAIIYGCANRVAPDGGPYDDQPPKLVRSHPADRELNVSSKKVSLWFDEFVTIKDPLKKIIVSPPQLQQPEIISYGKKVVVSLKDTLTPNTTYTIDFTDAIVDNNEGNPLENFSFAFSTGDRIDTMEIAGTVLNARTHEPMQGLLVGLHPDTAPRSAFHDTTFLRTSRTSDKAKFVIRNVREGRYHVYALKESDGNYRNDMVGTEGVAWLDSAVLTTCKPDIRPDTLWVDSLTIDTIKQVPFTHYYPDDLVLLYYEPRDPKHFLKKRERPVPYQLRLTFNALPDSAIKLARVDSLALPTDTMTPPYVMDKSKDGVVSFFFTDTTWSAHSTFALTYLSVDSLGLPAYKSDTLRIAYKAPKIDKEEKKRKSAESDSTAHAVESPFSIKIEHKGKGGISDSILFASTLPIDTSMLRAFALYDAKDSILQPMRIDTVTFFDGSVTSGLISARLSYGGQYELHVDSAEIADIYGHRLDKTVVDAFKVKEKSDFSSLRVTIHDLPDSIIGELLTPDDKLVWTSYSQAGEIFFPDLDPGKYGLRIIYDRNGNHRWDPGDYDASIQPEAVYYAPKVFELMKNWEVKENFYPLLTPLLTQKPRTMIQTKFNEEKRKDRNKEREEELRRRREGGGDQPGGNPFGGQTPGGALGGMRQAARGF